MTDTNNDVPIFVTQARASFLLGISEAELRHISQELGLGQLECVGNEQEIYFTYEELQRIFLLVCPARSSFFAARLSKKAGVGASAFSVLHGFWGG